MLEKWLQHGAQDMKKFRPRSFNVRNIKHTDEIKQFIKDNFKLSTDGIGFESEVYCTVSIRIQWQNSHLIVPLAHLIWILNTGEWPKDGLHIDHIDDNSINNAFNNLQEVTLQQNNFKKRGRGSPKYGSGKYGFGLGISKDRDRNKYKVYQVLPIENKERKQIKVWLGRFNSIEDAENFAIKLGKEMADFDILKEFGIEDDGK